MHIHPFAIESAVAERHARFRGAPIRVRRAGTRSGNRSHDILIRCA